MTSKPFPHPKGGPSFWRSAPGELDNYRSPEGIPPQIDIAIIGSGFSGGSLVTHLLNSMAADEKSILVLEARELCSGATGRNGGHLKPDVYNMASYLASKHGIDAATEVADFELDNVRAVEEYVRNSGADCDFFLTRAVDVQLSESHNTSLKAGYDRLIDASVESTKSVFYLHGKDAEMISGIKGAKGAFSYTAGHVWPYKMIHHMFSRAIAKGVNVQTNTPVLSISQSQEDYRWVLKTKRGTVLAKQVLMATNAYTAALLPEYHNKIIPYRAVCSRIVTPSSPPLLPNTYAIRFNDWDFDYLIPRPDGSIVVGGARRTYLKRLEDWYGNVNDEDLIKRAKHYFDGYMQRHFRGWENSSARTDQVWTGIMGYSSDRLPRLGRVFLAAKGIVQMVLTSCSYADSMLPSVFEETSERLSSPENFVMDLFNNLPSEPRL
ncbi:hypothetical protein V2G26_010902 [Clonostachys chloroleuca]